MLINFRSVYFLSFVLCLQMVYEKSIILLTIYLILNDLQETRSAADEKYMLKNFKRSKSFKVTIIFLSISHVSIF